ncbi:MAG: hypothetical protein Q9207_004214 [Kuettlingeria erythrocarpa]
MVWGAVVMALELLIAGIVDKCAQISGPSQRSFGAGVATFPFLYTATFGATWLTHALALLTEIFRSTSAPKAAPGRSLEQMDTFFEHGGSWNVFKASKGIRAEGLQDWRWMKKMKAEDHEELEKGRRMSSVVRLPQEDEKDARMIWRKRQVYTFRRKGSNAEIM